MTSDSIITFLHLVGAITWVGGMIYMNFVLMPSLSKVDPFEAGKLMAELGKRFTIIAWTSIIFLVITGFMQVEMEDLFDFSTDYNSLLSIKVSIVLLMILIAVYVTAVVIPKMRKLAPQPGEAPSQEFISTQKMLPILAKINMTLGILVILIISQVL